MARPIVYDEAIVTSQIRYLESDCIVRLFCKKHGKISAFVKNGLGPSKSRKGRLQVPSRAKVGLIPNSRTDLYRLAEIDVATYVIGFGNSLKAFGWASYIAELLEVFFAENDEPGDFFDVADEILGAIGEGRIHAEILRSFELKLLEHVGLLPDLAQAVDYQGRMVTAYDPASGHLLFEGDCGSVAFSEEARLAAVSLLNDPVAGLKTYSESTLRQIAKIFSFRLREQKKGPLKSIEFLREIGSLKTC